MPTARELLDQADALMRRNRSGAGDDIPVLTEAVPAETVARMTLSGLLAGGLAEPREQFDATPMAFDLLDDVPVLTDAVEEIEVPSVLDSIEPGGEPSAWLDFDDDGTRSVIDAAVNSIVVVPDLETPDLGRNQTEVECDFDQELQSTGRDDGVLTEPQPEQPEEAPGVIAEIAAHPKAVAFVEELTPTQDEEVVAVGFAPQSDEVFAEEVSPQSDEVLDLAEAVSPQSDEAAVLEESAAQPGDAIEEPTAPREEAVDELTTPQDEPVLVEETAAQAGEPVVLEEIASQRDEPVVAEEFASQRDEPIVAEEFASQRDEAVVLEELALQPDEPAGIGTFDTPALAAIAETTAPAPALLARDDARWAAVAEEIRMQVLQRIDLFTDTGLREQLGKHLQPIVERASVELVATINREVGELLRAYVAEAIEREIERWRQENGEKR